MQVWIGLVGVGSLPGNETLGDAKGAYVNAVAMAADPQEYEKAVSAALTDLGLFAFEFEDVERFSERAAHRQLDEQLRELADEAKRTKKVCFAEFHTYAALDG